MREIRSSGSVEGVLGNHDSYSDSAPPIVSQPQAGWTLLSEVGGSPLRGATGSPRW